MWSVQGGGDRAGRSRLGRLQSHNSLAYGAETRKKDKRGSGSRSKKSVSRN